MTGGSNSWTRAPLHAMEALIVTTPAMSGNLQIQSKVIRYHVVIYFLQGSNRWRSQALSTSPLVERRTSDAKHSTCQMFRSDFVFHNGLHHSPIKVLSDISHCWWPGVLDPPQRRIGPEPAHRQRPCLHTGETQYESSAKASMKPLEKFWFSPRRNYTWKIALTKCLNSSKDFWLFLLIAEGCWQWNWENWQRWHWRVICGSQWGAASKHTSNLTSKDRLCQYMDIWADLDQQYPDQISTGEMIILEVIRKLSPEQVHLSFFRLLKRCNCWWRKKTYWCWCRLL